MKHRTKVMLTLASLTLAIAVDGWAVDETRFSGFLDDYSRLKPVLDKYNTSYHAPPDIDKKLAKFDAVMIDQPEIFIDEESKYKGMKPDDMLAIANAFREIVTEEVKKTHAVVEEKGPNVLYLRFALSGLYLTKKWSKNPLAYTPVGFIAHGAKSRLTKDITKKINLVEANLEVQMWDSHTSKLLAELYAPEGLRKDKEKGQKASPATWEGVEQMMQVAAARFHCRLENSRRPEEQRVDCFKKITGEDQKK